MSIVESTVVPISVMGVVIVGGQILLCQNERAEWELPGGRIESGESPIDCLRREVRDQTGLDVEPGPFIHGWVLDRRPLAPAPVRIETYGCAPLDDQPVACGSAHRALGLFDDDSLEDLPMLSSYRLSVLVWRHLLG